MTQLEMVMTQEFVGQQLILLVGCLDTSEEGGRSEFSVLLSLTDQCRLNILGYYYLQFLMVCFLPLSV